VHDQYNKLCFTFYLFFTYLQGPVEVDETVSTTLLKEFNQEALCSENANEEERQHMSERLEQLFANGIPVSKPIKTPFIVFDFAFHAIVLLPKSRTRKNTALLKHT